MFTVCAIKLSMSDSMKWPGISAELRFQSHEILPTYDVIIFIYIVILCYIVMCYVLLIRIVTCNV